MRKKLIVILGPTASGKTALAFDVAGHFGAPVVSCDSRQFYRQIPIGTAAPTLGEQKGVPHYFVGNRDVTDFYSCGQYEADALELLDGLFREHDHVVMVGGSGLYIDAVCEGMDDMPAVDPSIRTALCRRFEQEGLEPLLEELKSLDPTYFGKVDRRNPARVIRGLEICLGTGKTFTELRKGRAKERPFRVIRIGVNMPREELYRRIDRRVEEMLEAGLEQEARQVYSLRGHNALQTVGYRELFSFFDGEITRLQAVELIKRNSRRYAKRQMTWFGRNAETVWFTRQEVDRVIGHILDCEE